MTKMTNRQQLEHAESDRTEALSIARRMTGHSTQTRRTHGDFTARQRARQRNTFASQAMRMIRQLPDMTDKALTDAVRKTVGDTLRTME